MIVFKPIGSLDITTDPCDLPDEGMQRCKNLRMDENGVLKLRDGSYKLNSTAMAGTMDFIIEQGGNRYVFGGQYIYKNESLISTGIQCSAPEYSPAAGEYAATQSVEITSDTVGATIYYTLDGTTPSESSAEYVSAISVPLYTTLKAVAVRDGFLDSDITVGYYSSTTPGTMVTETGADTIVTETDNDTLVTEGAP